MLFNVGRALFHGSPSSQLGSGWEADLADWIAALFARGGFSFWSEGHVLVLIAEESDDLDNIGAFASRTDIGIDGAGGVELEVTLAAKEAIGIGVQ